LKRRGVSYIGVMTGRLRERIFGRRDPRHSPDVAVESRESQLRNSFPAFSDIRVSEYLVSGDSADKSGRFNYPGVPSPRLMLEGESVAHTASKPSCLLIVTGNPEVDQLRNRLFEVAEDRLMHGLPVLRLAATTNLVGDVRRCTKEGSDGASEFAKSATGWSRVGRSQLRR
jgi:hypothetical protein